MIDPVLDYCPRCGYAHPNCKCFNEMVNVPGASGLGGITQGAGGGSGGMAAEGTEGASTSYSENAMGENEAVQLAKMHGYKSNDVLNFAEGGEVPQAPSSVKEVLSSIPESAGSSVDGAMAVNSKANEAMLGDPSLNGEHLVGQSGLKDIISGKLNSDVIRASEKAEDPTTGGLGHLEKVINKHVDHVDSHQDGIMGESVPRPESNEVPIKDHKELIEKINSLANNPSALIDNMGNSTAAIHSVAPKTAASAQQAAMRAIQFLASKSSQPDSGALNKPYEPSQTEVSKFNRYLEIVENPALALHQIKEGTLTPETTETLKNVYPALYEHMKQGLIQNLDKDVPYQKQIGISQFLEEPMDSSLSFQRIVNLQGSYAQAQAAQNQPASKSSKPASGLSKLDIADRTSLHPDMED